MIIGIHGPVGRGLEGALETAVSLGLPALQMLPYRRHHIPGAEDLAAFRAKRSASGVTRLVVHSRFVPSLASSDERRRERSAALLAMELRLASGLGAEAYILHAGAYSPEAQAAEGMRLCVEAILSAVVTAGTRIPIWVENVPGGGRRIGGTLEEVAAIIRGLRRTTSSGACLDTAHAHAAGYDLSSAEGMLKFLAQVNRVIGAENVRCWHLNDTHARLESHRESHAVWGEGFLGREGLRELLRRDAYRDCLGIIEPPLAPDSYRKCAEFVQASAA